MSDSVAQFLTNSKMTSIAHVISEDIVCEIFTNFSAAINATCPIYFPWYLGHICSAWRATFLSMVPQFWHKLDVYNPCLYISGDPGKLRRITNIVKFFLERNCGHQFDLDFSCSCEKREWDQVSNIFDML